MSHSSMGKPFHMAIKGPALRQNCAVVSQKSLNSEMEQARGLFLTKSSVGDERRYDD